MESKNKSNNSIKHLFQNHSKNLLCSLVLFALHNNVNRKLIGSTLNVFNTLSGKTKFIFVETFKTLIDEPGIVEDTTRNILYAAKPQFYHHNFALNEIKQCTSLVVKMTEVKIIGSSNVILTRSGEAIYESSVHDNDNNWDYTDTSIYSCTDHGFILKHRASKESIQCGIMLSGNYSSNYYHFMYEFLSKFFLMEKLNLQENIPIIVDDIIKTVPQFHELLNHINRHKRKLIYIKNGCSYNVKTLYYPSLLNIIPPNFKNVSNIRFSDCMFNLDSITFLRDALLSKMRATESYKRIFLSRKNATSRRRYNEGDVVKIFEKYGFKVICPEEYGIAEQIYLFNNAEFIAGASGAAFTNILFCKQGCKILCFNSVKNELSIFSTIAKHLGLDFQYLAAHEEPHNTKCLHEEFAIDPAKAEDVLVNFLSKQLL